jgi:hypothetical protein
MSRKGKFAETKQIGAGYLDLVWEQGSTAKCVQGNFLGITKWSEG